MTRVYKVVTEAEWSEALRNGAFRGAMVDYRDGYIHLSTAGQVEKTVELYFADRDDLVLVALDGDDFKEVLKWEPSRGGALFPHLYASFDIARALFAKRFSSRDPQALRSFLEEP